MLAHDGVVYTTMTNAGYARIGRFVSLPRIRSMFPVGDQWGVFVGEDNILYVLLQVDTLISLNRKHFEYASAFTGWVDMKIHNIPRDTHCSSLHESEEFDVHQHTSLIWDLQRTSTILMDRSCTLQPIITRVRLY